MTGRSQVVAGIPGEQTALEPEEVVTLVRVLPNWAAAPPPLLAERLVLGALQVVPMTRGPPQHVLLACDVSSGVGETKRDVGRYADGQGLRNR